MVAKKRPRKGAEGAVRKPSPRKAPKADGRRRVRPAVQEMHLSECAEAFALIEAWSAERWTDRQIAAELRERFKIREQDAKVLIVQAYQKLAEAHAKRIAYARARQVHQLDILYQRAFAAGRWGDCVKIQALTADLEGTKAATRHHVETVPTGADTANRSDEELWHYVEHGRFPDQTTH